MTLSPIEQLRAQLAGGDTDAVAIAVEALSRSNSNSGKNVYLEQHPDQVRREAEALAAKFAGTRPPLFGVPVSIKDTPLFGVPVSIKDCFTMQGFRTSCGSRFYRELHGIAQQDSAVVARLRRSGAIILGKTHLHQLAYGITGENRDYGDCAQPGSPGVLTGGSSSGAAASVMEGSAVAAIGTDTGGSIRAPAALCGLAGYRSSLGLGGQEIWRGGYHLAPSFDTLGWLFRDLRDGPVLAHALFGIQVPREVANSTPRIGVPNAGFLHDCEPRVWAAFEAWQHRLRSLGAEFSTFDTAFWSDGMEIFAGIQAHEAATIHRGHFDHFEATIAERLKWGESIPASEVRRLRSAHIRFREQMDQLFNEFDFLMLPSSPLSALPFGRDHSLTRGRILRYTVPASLSGNPVVALPADGGGVQLIASRDADTELLALAAKLGEKLAQLEIARL